MKLILLGTTGYHPNDRRQTACFMLPEVGVLLDAGTALYRLNDYLATEELDIYITHAHLDHVVGITCLFDVVARHPLRRISVHGEADKLQAIQDHLLAEPLFPAIPPCDFRELTNPSPLPQQGKLSYFPLQHPGGSIGFRLDWPGHSMAYVTDTTAAADADYVERIRDVDLLIHECYFDDDATEQAHLTGHSCLTPVVQVARKANAKRLVLVHINPLIEDDADVQLSKARALFPRTELGIDRAELEF